MSGSYWRQVHAHGLAVPSDRPLDDLTAELTAMLGSPDPELRDGIAYPALATWVSRGVYDDLLSGLGDGMAAGLRTGLGATGDDSVFRRSLSALLLGECIARDNRLGLVPAGKVMEWGDRIATWLLREKDLRGFVPGKGVAHAIAHGADALASLAASPHLGTPEATVVLDVVADRVLAPAEQPFTNGEPDRLAHATMEILRRDLVPLSVLEPWVARIEHRASTMGAYDGDDPFLASANAQSFLRALHLQVALAPEPPPVRADLLLVLVDALRAANPLYLRRRAGRH